MKKRIPGIICGLLILLFAYTAFSKLLAFHRFESVLSRVPLIGDYAAILAVLIPAVELMIVLLLLVPRTQQAGLIASTMLLMIFTAYLIFIVLTDPNLPCSCGGVIQQLSWKQHIVFNFCFILLGMAGIYFQRNIIPEKDEQTIYEPL